MERVIAESPQMRKILKDLEKIAGSSASVLITGESGTGKEVIGAVIHALSPRAKAPFVKVNCAAIPETLVESEFFGHERGSFTGALQRKIGRVELAHQGTLFLDEVTEIPLSLQAKLLRAIQEKEFERVGGLHPIRVDVRFVATSNRNLQEAIESQVFREDLFYRLNVIPIHLPPLRERREDILPLAHYFLHKFCHENQKPLKHFTDQAIARLLAYPWPGNVRELSNFIERIVVLDFDELIDPTQLYLDAPEKPSLPIGMTLHEMEKRLILETLDAHHHNKTKTAAILGISVRTLRNKLHEYGAMVDESWRSGFEPEFCVRFPRSS
jgi:two-component system response regulator AtoC